MTLKDTVDALLRAIPEGQGDLRAALLWAAEGEGEDDWRAAMAALQSYMPDDDPPPYWVRAARAIWYGDAVDLLPGDVLVKWDAEVIDDYGSLDEALAGIRKSHLYASMPEARDDYWFFEVLDEAGSHRTSKPGGWFDEHGRRVINGWAVRELGNLLKDE